MPFHVIPAIDLRGGRVVRLLQGDFARETAYADDPVAVAREWDRQGAEWIHVVDLDGAKEGKPRHLHLVGKMATAVEAGIELGGGLRSMDDVARAFENGVDRVVLGTGAIWNLGLLVEAAKRYWRRIALAIDYREGRLATSGWAADAAVDLFRFMEMFKRVAGEQPLPLACVICTDITRDGMQSGPDSSGAIRVAQGFGYPVIVSGGIASLDDIRKLRGLEPQGVAGVIVGKALYEGAFTLEEALKVVREHAG